MTDKIELCFFKAPVATEHGIEGDQQDTRAEPAPSSRQGAYEDREKNKATLEQLHIGQCTVAEVVRGVERVLGHELYPTKIHKQDEQTTKVFLEQRQPSRTDTKELDTIYDLTDGGEVNTNTVRIPGTKPRLEDHMFVAFQTTFTKPPSILLGLNYLNVARSGNLRIQGTATQIHDHLFEVHSRAWADTTIHEAGFTWLAVPTYTHPLLQIGTFNTTEDHHWNLKQDITTKRITFRSPYLLPPKVVVWLDGINTRLPWNDRCVAFATDIRPTGFSLHINTWGDTHLSMGNVSWFAYPVDTLGICSGDLQPTTGAVGVITFDKPFARPPRRILVALNKLDVDVSSDCRLKVIHEAVSSRGMAVRVETWGDSKIHSAGIAYIAME